MYGHDRSQVVQKRQLFAPFAVIYSIKTLSSSRSFESHHDLHFVSPHFVTTKHKTPPSLPHSFSSPTNSDQVQPNHFQRIPKPALVFSLPRLISTTTTQHINNNGYPLHHPQYLYAMSQRQRRHRRKMEPKPLRIPRTNHLARLLP